jgi:hypothetical protein
MTNYLNFATHVVREPLHYSRAFENDLPKETEEESAWKTQAQRAALIALPFLSMIKPLGFAISTGMGGCRVVTHFAGVVDAGGKQKWLECTGEVAQTALAVATLAFSIFNFTLGMIVVTGVDTTRSAIHVIQLLESGQYSQALEELGQVMAGALYLGMMVTGSLEFMLLSTLLQAAISLYQANSERVKGRYPEAITKAILGTLRLGQAKNYLDLIQRRDELLASQKFAQLFARISKGRDAAHLIDSPLADLQTEVEGRNVVLSDANGKEYDFGSYFHGNGKGLVKGANLNFRTRVIEDGEKLELDFKVNHVFRTRLQGLIEQLKEFKPGELKELLALAGSHASDIRIEETGFPVGTQLIGFATKITFEGIGSIWVGASQDFPNLYDRVVIQLDMDKSIYAWHELLSFLDLENALSVSSDEDMERLKMGHLYRIFFPKEATPFERTEEFFDLPVEELKTKILERSPLMGEIFDSYLNKMEMREILPGKIRYAIPGFADSLRSHGAKELVAAVGGYKLSKQELCERLATVLKMGMLSSETRYENGINVVGMSTEADFESGGADSAFTRMLTEHSDPNNLAYWNRVRLLISLEATETGTYQYLRDSYGIRRTDYSYYWDRPNMEEFVDTLNQSPNSYRSNEVMVKERIPPSYIQGIVIEDADLAKEMIEYFRSKDLIQKDSGGNEMIFGKLVEEFFKVVQKE